MSYNHAFFQTFCMFLGEFLCLGVYAITQRNAENPETSPALREARKKGLKTHINVLLLAIPACFDIIASTLMFVALTMIQASIYQMMRGLIVFVAAILSIMFLKRRFYRHHWTALVLVVSGVAIVGASPVIYPENNSGDDEEGKSVALGIILLIAAQFFAGGLMITEEKLLGNYYLHPLKVVGWEGFWGCFIYIILLFIMQFIPCHNDGVCPYGKVEDTPQAFYEMGDNAWIWVLGLGSVFSIAFFNAFGVSVTKYASAAQRSTIDTSRTLLIWVFFLVKPGKGQERFIWLELVGFVLLVAGTLIFNEIVVVPLFGFNQWTKKAIHDRALEEGENQPLNPKTQHETAGSATDFQGSSPAHYNYQRNYRNAGKQMEAGDKKGKGDKMKMEGLD
uniref:Solute carrier family 35 member F6 n=1 Tax=Euplotes harpa TaxID=151035 RepID=A0A7S3N6J9_9SPIT|mmetsp:Transcript_27080/g.31235  ORF Transcript_27080/g.31235 Transcript_27080/m.31235 type:complete len:392 (+) Transcript_27080:131-1306(+)